MLGCSLPVKIPRWAFVAPGHGWWTRQESSRPAQLPGSFHSIGETAQFAWKPALTPSFPDSCVNPSLSVASSPDKLLWIAFQVKNPPTRQETWVQLAQIDPLEKKMATHSSILAWEIPWTEEPGGLQFMGLQRVRHNLATKQQQQNTYPT